MGACNIAGLSCPYQLAKDARSVQSCVRVTCDSTPCAQGRLMVPKTTQAPNLYSDCLIRVANWKQVIVDCIANHKKHHQSHSNSNIGEHVPFCVLLGLIWWSWAAGYALTPLENTVDRQNVSINNRRPCYSSCHLKTQHCPFGHLLVLPIWWSILLYQTWQGLVYKCKGWQEELVESEEQLIPCS